MATLANVYKTQINTVVTNKNHTQKVRTTRRPSQWLLVFACLRMGSVNEQCLYFCISN